MVLMLALPVNINCVLQNCGAKPKPTTGQRKTEIFLNRITFWQEKNIFQVASILTTWCQKYFFVYFTLCYNIDYNKVESVERNVFFTFFFSSSSFFFFFFFFFYRLHNAGWVLVCSTVLLHSCLSSAFTLQPVILILFRSSSTWSIHLNLGLPTGLALYGVHSVIFLVVFCTLIVRFALIYPCCTSLRVKIKFLSDFPLECHDFPSELRQILQQRWTDRQTACVT